MEYDDGQVGQYGKQRFFTLIFVTRQKERIIMAYNKKVKAKVFAIDEYVSKVILHMDHKYIFLGKWSLILEGPF